MDRRHFLALAGTALGAGCSGQLDSTTETVDATTTRTQTRTIRPHSLTTTRTETATATETPTETQTETPTETATETPTATPQSYENIWLNNVEYYDQAAGARFSVRYNWQTQDWLSVPRAGATVESLDGRKFLVVQFHVTNVHSELDEALPVLADYFDVRVDDGVQFEHFRMDDTRRRFAGTTLNEGSTMSDWLAYEIPADVERAKLVRDAAAYSDYHVNVLFDQDESLAIDAEQL
jgi:hypothetical protein